MKVTTSRFGVLDVAENDIIKFEDGLLGFEAMKRFFIVDPADDTLILWMQSLDSPEVAFPVLEPKIFKSDYKVHLSGNELRCLKIENTKNKDTLVYCILTIPDDVSKMTANLKAPIVVNTASQTGRQVVLQENEYSVKYSMYKELLTVIMSSAGNARVSAEPSNSIAMPLSLRGTISKVEVFAL